MHNLLRLKNLTVEFFQNKQVIPAVKEANLEIKENEIVGLVGESGSGKTITTLAITRILSSAARITSGEVIFEGIDLLKIQEEQLREVRGKKIAYIFQEPTMFLNPIKTCGFQVAEAIITHQNTDKSRTFLRFRRTSSQGKVRDKFNARKKAIELLKQVRLSSPEEIFFDYPHQLSGGMNQRVMIAQALASNPKLLIADEPTTNLDVDTEKEILDLLLDLHERIGFSCLFITHNLGLIKRLCSRVYVMYRGSIVEEGNLNKIFTTPQHEHTKALVEAFLKIGQ